MSKRKVRKKSQVVRMDSVSGGIPRNNVSGGIQNFLSGMGGKTDKSTGSFFVPLIFGTANELQTIYAQSWAARKFIDIPVDDQFILGRTFESDDEQLIDQINAFEDEHDLDQKLADAQKAGRLYGDAILWMVTGEAAPETPLNVERLRPGDLKNLIVVDRFDLSVHEMQNDPLVPGYQEPVIYRVNLVNGTSATVHSSRVIRFSGKRALTARGLQNYGDQWFGISELTDILVTIMSDSTLEKAVTHLINESSIPVIKMKEFTDAICGDDTDLNLETRLQAESIFKSVFRTTYIDANDDFTRLNASFAGLPELMDRFAARLSAAADIPATRFLGRSPQGMSATGDSDMKNYALSVQSRQEKTLRPAYNQFDSVMAAILGVPEIPDFTFPSLVSADEKAQADTLLATANGLSTLIMSGVLVEAEARDILRKSTLFSSLEEGDPQEVIAGLAGSSAVE